VIIENIYFDNFGYCRAAHSTLVVSTTQLCVICDYITSLTIWIIVA